MTMSQSESEMLGEISASPDDDSPRLAYASWLDAHGEADRAEFIRLQLEKPGRPKLSPHWPVLDRSAQLLKEHAADWLASHAQSYSGGFVEHAYVSPRLYPSQDERWRRLAPACIAEIKPKGVGEDEAAATRADYEALAACPSLSGWVHLMIYDRPLAAAGFLALMASPHLTHLRYLDSDVVKLGDSGALSLSVLPAVSGLARLTLSNAGLGDEGARALAASPHLRNLSKLALDSNKIGDDGAASIADSPHMANLRWIELSGNRIGDPGALALARSPHLGDLTHLYLDDQSSTIGQEVRHTLRERFGEAVCFDA